MDPLLHAFRLLLLTMLVGACAPPRKTIIVPVMVRYGTQELQCTNARDPVVLSDFRAFLHNVSLTTDAGERTPAQLLPDRIWQSAEVALIDLEDGQGSCRNGSQETNASLRLSVPAGDYTGISFQLGVPEQLNHADPLLAESPLNMTAMHWHWRSGYKFLRAGIRTPDDGFWMHLGSARCSGTIGNIQGCDAPNRTTIELNGFKPGEHAIVFDLQALTATIDLQQGVRSDCSSAPSESECRGPFAALGLEFESGLQVSDATAVRLDLIR